MGYNKIPLALRYNDTTNNAEGLIEFQLNLSDVGDACSSAPETGQALVYNADGEWCPSTLPAPGSFNGNLSDVGQVCSATPSAGQALVWSSTVWCPSTIQTGGGGGGAVNSVNDLTGDVSLYLSSLSGVEFAELGGLNGDLPQHLQWNGTNWVNAYEDEQYIKILNNTGSTLTKGQVVYVSGFQGDQATVGLAKADSSTTMPSIGIVYSNILDTESGLAVTFGTAGVDNSLTIEGSPVVGDTLYVSPNISGNLTATKPTDSSHLIQNVGVLLKSGSGSKVKVTGVGRSNDIPNTLSLGATGETTITSATAKFTGTTADQLVLTDTNNELGSVASSTLFTQGIADNNIATTPIPDGDLASTFIKTDASTVNPTNLSGTIADGELVKKTDANQFVGVTTTADSETFLGTNANLEDATNVTATLASKDLLQYDGTYWQPRTLSEVQTNSDPVGRIDLGGLGNVDDSDSPPLDIPEAQTLLYDRATDSYVVSALKHSTLSGLGDDDHTQYVLSGGSRAMSALTVTNDITAATVSSTSSTIVDGLFTRLPGSQRPDNFYWYEDYLTTNAAIAGWAYAANGGSLGHQVTLLQTTDSIGILELRTNSANNRVHLTTFNQTINCSSIGASLTYRVTANALYDATTNQGDMLLGIFNNTNIATEPTNGIFFRYSDGSTNWQAESVAGGTTTQTDTGVAVAVGTFNVLQLIVDQDWTEVKYYVDGVLKATHTLGTDNIPTGNTPMGIAINSINGATASGQELHIDWHLFKFFTTADRGQSLVVDT